MQKGVQHKFKSLRKNSNKWLLSFSIFLFLGVFSAGEAFASHIVGGELTYRCLGDNRIEIILTVFRDCENALPEADFDDPASVTVFRKTQSGVYNLFTPTINLEGGTTATGQILLFFNGADTLRDPIPTGCLDEELAPDVCVQRAVYRRTITRFPSFRGDLHLVYQRCCRNTLITNIEEPLETGASYRVTLTQEARESCNSAPEIADFPPLFLCRGVPFSIPQGGPDIDGDSIVYSLCAPFEGATMGQPKPQPANPPPYDSVRWITPLYSTLDMLGNPDDPLTIDPQTGVISGTPLINGQFLVGICYEEYREGRFINNFRRDFQLNIRSCDFGPIADFILPEKLCDDSYRFINTSIDANVFEWWVDSGDGPVFFSDEEDPPTYQFPDTGQYFVTLIAGRDTLCFDTLTKPIQITISGLIADFDVVLEECQDSIVLAPVDLSTDSIAEIVKWFWEVDTGDSVLTSTDQAPKWVFYNPLTVDIRLTVTSSDSCTESILKENIKLGIFDFEFVGDTVEICPWEPTRIVLISDPDLMYTWSPERGLDLTNPHDPIVITDSSTLYRVTITDGICEVVDSIMVIIKPVSEIILSDIADSCDLERVVIAEGLVPGSGLWYDDNTYTNVIGQGDTLRIDVPISRRVYFTGIDTISECLIRDSIDLRSFIVNLEYDAKYDFCINEFGEINLNNIDPLDSIIIMWEPNDLIVSDLDQTEITVFSAVPIITTLYFEAFNQFGCELRDSIVVEYHPFEEVSFEFEYTCGDSTVQFFNTSPPGVPILWDFGDGNTSTEDNPVHTYSGEGVYIVTLTSTWFCPDSDTAEIVINFFDISLMDTIIACFGEPVTLNPGGDPGLSYQWSPENLFNDPTEASPTIQVNEDTRITVIIFDPDADTSCIRFDTIDIIVPPPFAISVDPDTIISCTEEQVTLSVDINPSDADVTIVWTNDAGQVVGNTPEIEITTGQSSFYTVTVTDEFGCQLSETIPELFDLFDFNIEVQGEVICAFDTLLIIITGLDPDDEFIIEWADHPSIISGHRSDTLVVFPTESTTYSVAVTNQDGCVRIKSVTVDVRDLSMLINAVADPDEVFKKEESFLFVEGGDPLWTYIWEDTSANPTLSDPTIINPIVTPERTTTYFVTVIDEFGCVARDSVTVEVEVLPCDEPYIFIPNAFSPNDDNENDVLFVNGRHIVDMELIIYNRWGHQVFRSVNQWFGWDGSWRGDEMPPDVYAYHLWVECVCGGTFTKSGNVTLVR